MSRHPLWAVGALTLTAALTSGQGITSALAQDDSAVAYVVLFYSPTCPHCALVIEEELPALQQEFGDQLQLLLINTATPEGQVLILAAYETFEVPPERRGVPTMVIGSRVLVGSLEIPQWASLLIREGLESGGVDLPPIPGLREAYERALAESMQEAENSPAATPEQATQHEAKPVPTRVAERESASSAALDAPHEDLTTTTSDTLMGRLARDPFANLLSIGVLLGLGASLGVVVAAGIRGLKVTDERPLMWLVGQTGRWAKAAMAGIGFFVAVTLVAQPTGGPYAMPLAMGMATGLAVILSILWASASRNTPFEKALRLPFGLISLTALVGLADAAYMAYVEATGAEAVCGAVGDCNMVQQSSYSVLFGILPVGVLGVFGNVAILLVLVVSRVSSGLPSDMAQVALLGMALLGTAFSTYLTFLEPFVIGATCAWCLTSAIAMMLLLWLAAPPGWSALLRLIRRKQ